MRRSPAAGKLKAARFRPGFRAALAAAVLISSPATSRAASPSPLGPYFHYDPEARFDGPLAPGWLRGYSSLGRPVAVTPHWGGVSTEQRYYGGARYVGGRYYTNQHFTHGHGPRALQRSFQGTTFSTRR